MRGAAWRTSLLTGAVVAATAALSQDMRGHGDADSIGFAQALWAAMAEARLVGDDAIRSVAFRSEPPHAAILEQVEGSLAVDGQPGVVIVKRNFSGSGLTRNRVQDAPLSRYLAAITVMYRADGTADWFWATYQPDGTLDRMDGVPVAGQVPFCADCHAEAHGGDFVFRHDRYAAE